MNKNIKVNVIGNYFGSDGYSAHTKQLAQALNNLEDVEVTMSSPKPEDWMRKVNDEELKMHTKNPIDTDINLIISTPISWPVYMCEDKPFIGFVVWEGDKIPVGWINTLLDERVTQIWVPSTHTLNAIIRTIELSEQYEILGKVVEKIRIVPHGVDLDLFKSEKKKEDRPFTFIANKGFRGVNDRGGLQYLFKAFNEEFTEKDDVELLVKINPSYGIPDFGKEFKKLGMKDNGSSIKILTDNVAYKDLVKIYNMGDIFVTTSMAESFNIPPLEAMACGKPVIATHFGGQSDFVNDKNGWMLWDGKMKEVTWDLMYEGICWKEPDIKEIRQMLRHCFDNREEVKKKAKKALTDSKKWTWDHSAIKAHECLKEINSKK